MTNHTTPSRATKLSAAVLLSVALGAAPAGTAFAADAPVAAASAVSASSSTGADLLVGTPWETTGAIDQDGNEVALTDEAVVNFVGWAYYDADGTFTMYNLDDTPKMQGDWAVSPDGSERTLVAKDDDGEILFERVVPITELTTDAFTYRVVPDEAAPETYFDVVHTPTDHAEPGTTSDAVEEDSTVIAEGNESAADEAEVAGNAGPIAAIVAGIVAVLGGAALVMKKFMRRGSTKS